MDLGKCIQLFRLHDYGSSIWILDLLKVFDLIRNPIRKIVTSAWKIDGRARDCAPIQFNIKKRALFVSSNWIIDNN